LTALTLLILYFDYFSSGKSPPHDDVRFAEKGRISPHFSDHVRRRKAGFVTARFPIESIVQILKDNRGKIQPGDDSKEVLEFANWAELFEEGCEGASAQLMQILVSQTRAETQKWRRSRGTTGRPPSQKRGTSFRVT
jgi:hypothetical protein